MHKTARLLGRAVKADLEKTADPNAMSALAPGQVVNAIDGSALRVASKVAHDGEFLIRFADLNGNVVKTPANFTPVSPALARTAAWMRFVFAYNADFDQYVKEYIKAAGLPVDNSMNWAKWFQSIYPRKLYGVTRDPEIVDEAIHQVIITALAHRKDLTKFDPNRLPEGARNQPLEKQVTTYLEWLFKKRVSEAYDFIKDRLQPEEEVSMEQPGDEESESDTSVNIVDTPENATPANQTQVEEATDLSRLRDQFAAYLSEDESPREIEKLLVIYDFFTQHTGRRLKISDYEQYWKEKTGLGFDSLKPAYAKFQGYIPEFMVATGMLSADRAKAYAQSVGVQSSLKGTISGGLKLALAEGPASDADIIPNPLNGPEAGPSTDELNDNAHEEFGVPVLDGNIKSPERPNVNAIRETLDAQHEMEVGKPIAVKEEEIKQEEAAEQKAKTVEVSGGEGGAKIVININAMKLAEAEKTAAACSACGHVQGGLHNGFCDSCWEKRKEQKELGGQQIGDFSGKEADLRYKTQDAPGDPQAIDGMIDVQTDKPEGWDDVYSPLEEEGRQDKELSEQREKEAAPMSKNDLMEADKRQMEQRKNELEHRVQSTPHRYVGLGNAICGKEGCGQSLNHPIHNKALTAASVKTAAVNVFFDETEAYVLLNGRRYVLQGADAQNFEEEYNAIQKPQGQVNALVQKYLDKLRPVGKSRTMQAASGSICECGHHKTYHDGKKGICHGGEKGHQCECSGKFRAKKEEKKAYTLAPPNSWKPRQPSSSEMAHERMRFQQAYDSGDVEKYLARRLNAIGTPQKLFNFVVTLEDENFHTFNQQAMEKLKSMGWDGSWPKRAMTAAEAEALEKVAAMKVAYVSHCPGHRNSEGDLAEWCVRQHNTDKILTSYTSEEKAKEGLKNMESHKGADESETELMSFNQVLESLGYESDPDAQSMEGEKVYWNPAHEVGGEGPEAVVVYAKGFWEVYGGGGANDVVAEGHGPVALQKALGQKHAGDQDAVNRTGDKEVDFNPSEMGFKRSADNKVHYVRVMRPQASAPGIPDGKVFALGYSSDSEFGAAQLEFFRMMDASLYDQMVKSLKRDTKVSDSERQERLYAAIGEGAVPAQGKRTDDVVPLEPMKASGSDDTGKLPHGNGYNTGPVSPIVVDEKTAAPLNPETIAKEMLDTMGMDNGAIFKPSPKLYKALVNGIEIMIENGCKFDQDEVEILTYGEETEQQECVAKWGSGGAMVHKALNLIFDGPSEPRRRFAAAHPGDRKCDDCGKHPWKESVGGRKLCADCAVAARERKQAAPAGAPFAPVKPGVQRQQQTAPAVKQYGTPVGEKKDTDVINPNQQQQEEPESGSGMEEKPRRKTVMPELPNAEMIMQLNASTTTDSKVGATPMSNDKRAALRAKIAARREERGIKVAATPMGPGKLAGSEHLRHDAEIVVSQVLNGGFEQLWDNFGGRFGGRRKGYNVPSMIERTADFFNEVAKETGDARYTQMAQVMEAAAQIDGNLETTRDGYGNIDEQASEQAFDERSNELDPLDNQFYDLWESNYEKDPSKKRDWEIVFPEKSQQMTQVEAKMGSKKYRAAKKAARKAKYARLQQVATAQPKEAGEGLQQVAAAFGELHQITSALQENLGLVASTPADTTLAARIASWRAYAKNFRLIAEEAPAEVEAAMREVYQGLDETAVAIENLAQNMGISLDAVAEEAPAPAAEGPEVGNGPMDSEVPEEVKEAGADAFSNDRDHDGHPREADKQAATNGSDGFVTDRDENGNPKPPVQVEVPRVNLKQSGVEDAFTTDRDENGQPKAPASLEVPRVASIIAEAKKVVAAHKQAFRSQGRDCDNCERPLGEGDFLGHGSWSYKCPECGFTYNHGGRDLAEQLAKFEANGGELIGDNAFQMVHRGSKKEAKVGETMMAANTEKGGGELHGHDHYERESCKSAPACKPKK